MRRGIAQLLVLGALALSFSDSVRANADDDVIFVSTPDYPYISGYVARPDGLPDYFPRIEEREAKDDWLYRANAMLAEVVQKFMSGMIPDNRGIEHPQPDENPIDQFVKRLGTSRFQFLLQGVGNLRGLSGPYLYNELQGGVGVEYDLVGETDNTGVSPSKTLVALRVSPLYGEFAFIRTAAGAAAVPDLPSRAMLGSSVGFEASHKFGPVEPIARAYLRPLVDTVEGTFGVSVYSALLCRIKLSDVSFEPHGSHAAGVYLTPEIAYFDRGAEQQPLYAAREPDMPRGVSAIRSFWQGLVHLEVRY